MSPQEPIVVKPKDTSGIKPTVSTPTRRQYWRSLRAMLAPQRFSLREEQFFRLLAVLIGIGSGLAVVCFRMCIEFLHLKLLGTGLQPSVPRVFLAPMLAGLVIAVLVIRFFPRAAAASTRLKPPSTSTTAIFRCRPSSANSLPALWPSAVDNRWAPKIPRYRSALAWLRRWDAA
jgi:hypothetical protein